MVGAYSQHQRLRRSSAKTVIDIQTIRLITDSNDICTQLMEDMRCNLVSSTMRTIEHDFQAPQIVLGRKCTLAKLDITALCVIKASGLTQFFRRNTFHGNV